VRHAPGPPLLLAEKDTNKRWVILGRLKKCLNTNGDTRSAGRSEAADAP
jgi:hypothetical protein